MIGKTLPTVTLLIFALLNFITTYTPVAKAQSRDILLSTQGILGNQDVVEFSLMPEESALVTVKQFGGAATLSLFRNTNQSNQALLSTGNFFLFQALQDEVMLVTGSDCRNCVIQIAPYENIDAHGKYQLTVKVIKTDTSNAIHVLPLFNEAASYLLSANRGVESEKKKGLGLALQSYLQAHRVASDFEELYWSHLALYRASQLYHRLSDFDQQREALERLVEVLNSDSRLGKLSRYELAQLENMNGELSTLIGAVDALEGLFIDEQDAHLVAYYMTIKADTLSRQGKNADAIEIYEQANELLTGIGDWRLLLQQKITVGWLYARLGDSDSAKREYLESLTLARTFEAPYFIANAATKLARLYRTESNYERAEGFIDLALSNKASLSNTILLGWAYQERARIYEALGQLVLAEISYHSAQTVFDDIGSHVDSVNIDYFLANLYLRQDSYQKALDYAISVLAFDERYGSQRDQANSHKRLGQIYREIQQLELSAEHYGQALVLAESLDNVYLLRELHAGMGKTQCYLNNSIVCRDHFSKAQAYQNTSQDESGWLDNTISYADALLMIGDVEQSGTLFRSAISEVHEQLNTLESASQIRSFQSSFQDLIGLYIDGLSRVGESSQSLLLSSEILRSTALLRRISQSGANRNASTNMRHQDLLALEQNVASFHLIAEKEQRFEALKQVALNAEAYELSIRNEVALNTPLKSFSREQLEQLQRQLTDKSLLIYFDTGPSKSFVWFITSSEIQVKSIAGDDELNSAVKLVKQSLSQYQGVHVEAIGRLSEEVFSGVPLDVTQYDTVTVFPDGALNALPFELLNVSEYVTLGDSHTVTYMPSLAVFYDMLQRDSKPKLSSALVISDPQVVAQNTLSGIANSAGDLTSSQLVFSNGETAILGEVLSNQVTILTGKDASKSAFLDQDIDSVDIIHFATHGVADDQHPALSGLVLSNVSETSSLLLLPEIESLDIGASLVVLSGCETAQGPVVNGEGMLGLGYAFMAAGAKNVIATHWKVQDDVAAYLMSQFYSALLIEKQSLGKALQTAKQRVRDYRLPSGYRPWSAPHYWAGFTMYGVG